MNEPLRWWLAPAKLNLFLHVTGRRADGYHELQTYFQLIDLCDELQFAVRSAGVFAREADDEPTQAALRGVDAEQDLCIRAARLLAEASGIRAGVSIRLRKRIPLGGGLGGGSSDAATTLRVLNRLWGIDWPPSKLATLGASLGADVPVFVLGRSAVGEGIGERLTPQVGMESVFLVLHPGVEVPTREIFQAAELTRNSPVLTIPALLAAGGRNDCEPVVRARFPEVAAALDWLSQHGAARLTGTGACIFARFDSEAEAARVVALVPPRWRAFVVRGVSSSPLLRQLGDDDGI
jgi:4-diphosphocytidyl-2-C-methyl-D-erythritol kinase